MFFDLWGVLRNEVWHFPFLGQLRSGAVNCVNDIIPAGLFAIPSCNLIHVLTKLPDSVILIASMMNYRYVYLYGD